MRLIARAAATLLTTTIVLGGSTTSAHAQSTTIKDKSSDVIAFADENDEQGVVLGYSDSVASGAEIRTLKVDHGTKNVTVTVRFAKLADGTTISVAFRPGGKSQPKHIFVNTGNRSGEVFDMRDRTMCAVPVTTKLGKSGSIKVIIKRSCLGNPKRLKVAAAAASYNSIGGDLKIDSVSRRNDPRSQTYTKWLKAS